MLSDGFFTARFAIPEDVPEGAIVVVDAGPIAHELFQSRKGGVAHDLGFYLPHLADVGVRVLEDF